MKNLSINDIFCDCRRSVGWHGVRHLHSAVATTNMRISVWCCNTATMPRTHASNTECITRNTYRLQWIISFIPFVKIKKHALSPRIPLFQRNTVYSRGTQFSEGNCTNNKENKNQYSEEFLPSRKKLSSVKLLKPTLQNWNWSLNLIRILTHSPLDSGSTILLSKLILLFNMWN